ncbi:MarR family transcriptional regulator [Cryobacterium frigoriphilum]|uniref:MarR family transcriptional regulator n=1 Tax=Cryobacterium frigoriphilum TaxID=1259150 RepID=A0A4R9A3Y3_9MICO|nr:MarR family winged helix-turn-helix transcriptional regulator [Cryobacterium frigoriphilum]TFD51218.1 MarR family transcriptional regulator [Cryobacterium frigoriphilum]
MTATHRPSVPGYWYPAPSTAAGAPEALPGDGEPAVSGSPGSGTNPDAAPGALSLTQANENAVAVLHAVRRFRRSDSAMRSRTASELAVNATDLAALRHLVAAARLGEHVTPTELSVQLGISSAATTKLLNRLALLGHVRREPHPTDRRGQLIVATDLAHTAIHQALGHSHKRMMDVVVALSAEEQLTVIRFLDALGEAVMEEHAPDPAAVRGPAT